MPSDSTEVAAAAEPAVEQLFNELTARLRELRPHEDLAPLEKAFRFAAERHQGQKRVSGEPYMMHPLMVTRQLAEMQMDMTCLETGLLHDVVEDTTATVEEIRKNFGDEVARCVDGVTKLSKLDLASREERQAESVRKMLLAMVDDIRVVIVKLADRLHNMRTLGCLPREKQERIAQETIDIYAPIAHRLGMGKVRGELEDLSFKYLEPDASAELLKEFETARPESEAFLNEVKHTVEVHLAREGIPARVETRLKRAYSVFQKLKRQKITLDQVYDLLAVRIITDSVKNCYAALGVIHNEWHPIPGRIKDFIAIPRPNLYQSLHTSVMGPGGRHFEVQIRTDEMHRIAEEGIAAHWKYKEGKRGPAADDQRIAWLRQLVEWQREMRDPDEFMSTLKVDLYPEEVYTFTPRGKVIVLPREATPIDFAYAIHSDVGNRCVGAKVNGRIVPLKSALRNGDVVEILTQSGHLPSKDWLARGQDVQGAQQNQARHQHHGARQGDRDRRKTSGAGSAPAGRRSSTQVTKAQLESVASEYGYSQNGGSARRAGLRKIFAAPGAAKARAGSDSGGSARGPGCAGSGSRARRARARRSGPGHQGERHRRSAGVSRQVLQSHQGRSHRRLRHARKRRGGAFAQLRQRAKPDVRGRAQNRRRMGAHGLADVSGENDGPHRGPSRRAEPGDHACW